MVGMPDVAVRESRERIKSAMLTSGFGYPDKAVTTNLASANVRKEGAGFDLPDGARHYGREGSVTGLDRHILVGELSLDGAILPGALSVAVCGARRAFRISSFLRKMRRRRPWSRT
jgi:magnesium chelatase family protein